MEFTVWQIDRLRSGLNSYRISSATNGRTPSWMAVIQEILWCPKNIHVPPKGGTPGDLRADAESLRRFAAGQVIPDQTKLDAIARFLIHEGEMDEAELGRGEPGTQSLLTAVLALGRQKKDSLARLLALEPEYAASRQGPRSTTETRRLLIVPDRENPFCRIEEHIVVVPRVPHPGRRKNEPEIKTINQGYGCVFTSANRVMIYVACNDCSDFAAMIEDGSRSDPLRSASLVLRRIDATEPGHVQDEDVAEQPTTYTASRLRLPPPS